MLGFRFGVSGVTWYRSAWSWADSVLLLFCSISSIASGIMAFMLGVDTPCPNRSGCWWWYSGDGWWTGEPKWLVTIPPADVLTTEEGLPTALVAEETGVEVVVAGVDVVELLG